MADYGDAYEGTGLEFGASKLQKMAFAAMKRFVDLDHELARAREEARAADERLSRLMKEREKAKEAVLAAVSPNQAPPSLGDDDW